MAVKLEKIEARMKSTMLKSLKRFREAILDAGYDPQKLYDINLVHLYPITASFLAYSVARHPELADMRVIDFIGTLTEAGQIYVDDMLARLEKESAKFAAKKPAAKKAPVKKPTKKGAK